MGLLSYRKSERFAETGVCRLTISNEDKEAVELVQSWMNEAGLESRIDHFANLIGTYKGLTLLSLCSC